MEEPTIESLRPPQRGTFLTILCVLTFIGSGFQITSNLSSYRTAEEQAAHPEEIIKAYDALDMEGLPESFVAVFEDIMESNLENLTVSRIKQYSMGMLLAGIFTFMGALAMWRLRRWGYHAYLAGIIAYMAMPWIAFMGLKATTQGFTALFIGLFMILMYSLNYRKLA